MNGGEEIKERRSKKKKKGGTTVLLLGNDPFKLDKSFRLLKGKVCWSAERGK